MCRSSIEGSFTSGFQLGSACGWHQKRQERGRLFGPLVLGCPWCSPGAAASLEHRPQLLSAGPLPRALSALQRPPPLLTNSGPRGARGAHLLPALHIPLASFSSPHNCKLSLFLNSLHYSIWVCSSFPAGTLPDANMCHCPHATVTHAMDSHRLCSLPPFRARDTPRCTFLWHASTLQGSADMNNVSVNILMSVLLNIWNYIYRVHP